MSFNDSKFAFMDSEKQTGGSGGEGGGGMGWPGDGY